MLFRRKKGERPADGTMSLMEHLYELRRRLFFAVLAIFLGAIVGFIWYTVRIPGIGSLSDVLNHPYCSVPADYRISDLQNPDKCVLLATTPFSPLQVRLKAAVLVGAVLAAPVWLGQLWGFVTPALYDRERKFARVFVLAGTLLFLAGTALAYVVIPEGLKVLLGGIGGSNVISGLDPNSYYGFLIAMLIIFGLSFEVPLLLVMLNFVGVLKAAKMAKARRYAIFGMVVLAGLVVPGNDPITMLALAVSLAVLYEVAVQIARIHDKRKAKVATDQGTDYSSLSDDEASPMPAGASGTGNSEPIADPTPVAPAEPVPPPPTVQPAPADDPTDLGDGPRDLGDAT